MMFKLPDFTYLRPSTLVEALELLSKLEDAMILAGGTDLVVDLKIGRYKPTYIIDIGGLKELKFIDDNGWVLRIGALTTIQEILESHAVALKTPLIKDVAEKFAYWQIRNIATIGGNLCNASPASDMAVPLLIYNATLRSVSVSGERYTSIEEFFVAPRRTVLRKDELLAEVLIPYRELEGAGTAYAKVGRRRGHDLSVVAVAVALKVDGGVIVDARVALNSVAPRPLRAKSVEERLVGREPSLDTFKEAAEAVANDISPITDVRAPAEYRLYMSKVLIRELLAEAYRKAYKGGFE
ncbi:MAG: xanthine dehydrogenase family protein subunit M [Desulfurococcaceae archaeon]